MAYKESCGQPKTKSVSQVFGTPTRPAEEEVDSVVYPKHYNEGRRSASYYQENYPRGIPVVPRTYYEERVLNRFKPNGIVDEDALKDQKWTQRRIAEETKVMHVRRTIFDEDLKVKVPRGLEPIYFLRKGIKVNKMLPWPYINVIRKEASILTRSSTESPPCDIDIVEEFVNSVRDGQSILNGIATPAFKTLEITISENVTKTTLTTFVSTYPECTNPVPGTKRYPATMEPADCADDRYAIGKKANCTATRIRASDTGCREPALVDSITIPVAIGVPKYCHSGCGCFNCHSNKHTNDGKKLRSFPFSEEQRREFSRKQEWNVVLFAPNASGKTTAKIALRELGLSCFEMDDMFDWFSHATFLRQSIMVTSDPNHLKYARNPIAVIPTEGERLRRFKFRKALRPNVRWKDALNLPSNTRVIQSNKMLTDLIQLSIFG